MLEVKICFLRFADACACSVTIVPSKTKRSSADLEVFAATTFQKGEAVGSHCGALGSDGLLSREHTGRV